MCYRILLTESQKDELLNHYPKATVLGGCFFFKSRDEFWEMDQVARYGLYSVRGNIGKLIVDRLGCGVSPEIKVKKHLGKEYYLSDIDQGQYIRMKERISKNFRKGEPAKC